VGYFTSNSYVTNSFGGNGTYYLISWFLYVSLFWVNWKSLWETF